jgi:hypothetical protein
MQSPIIRIICPVVSHQFLDPCPENVHSQTQEQIYKTVEVVVVYFTVLWQHLLTAMNKIAKKNYHHIRCLGS